MKFDRENLIPDLTAGATTALVTIPDGMASAILAGVTPVAGLYALRVGTPIAALTTSSQYMYVATTGAMAVAVGSVLEIYGEGEILAALLVLTVLTGLFQLLLGVLRLGGITRYVSNAVLTGFMTGIALNIIMGQLGDFTGYSSGFSNKVAKTVDLALHPTGIDWPTFLMGLLTIGLIILIRRTRLEKFSLILAMVATSLVVLILDLSSVQTIGDIAEIPRGLPRPVLPDLSLVPELIVPAITVGLVGLVQAAGVSRSVPNADGEFPDTSRDFAGQGLANTASGFFQGMPIGGTMSETSVNINAGARTRFANLFSGLLIILLVGLFGRAIEIVAMPAIAALLIVAGFETIKMTDIEDVRDTGPGPRLIMIFTFIATLFFPIQNAVLLGVVLSLLHYVYRSSNDINVIAISQREDGSLIRQDPPSEVPSGQVTTLAIYGSMFFASAYLLEESLPSPAKAKRAVVVLNLRSLGSVGSTFIKVIERYSDRLKEGGGKLILAAVTDRVYEQLELTETTDSIAPEDIFKDDEVLGHALLLAMDAAEIWLEFHPPAESNDEVNIESEQNALPEDAEDGVSE